MLGIALVAGSRALPAQTTSQSVPPELVTALFSGGIYASPSSRYFVGVVPPDWPTELVPAPPITVSGGMRHGDSRYAVFVDSAARHPLDTLRRQLEAAGWTRPPSDPPQGFTGGFQDDDGRYRFWCRDSVRAMLASTRGVGGLTYVRVGLETMRRDPCVPKARAGAMELAALKLPPLLPPDGIRSIGGGSGSGERSLTATTRLTDSTMSAAAVLAHYSAQLAKAGWTAYPPVSTTAFASQALEARDKDGMPWYGMLLVIPSAAAREVSIMMSRTSTR